MPFKSRLALMKAKNAMIQIQNPKPQHGHHVTPAVAAASE
jgi:hypothetical protein